jgi:photosystem II stability/assembly factor-like uncharacterized protein
MLPPRREFVTKDEGKSWSELNDGLLTKDVYTLAIGSDGQLYAGTRGYGVFRFNRNEEKWEQTSQLAGFGFSWHVWDRPMYQYTSLLIDPRNNSIMYLGAFPSGMFKSTDGGKTWKESNIGFFDDGVDGIFSLTFHPHNKSIIYAGTYNGVSVTYDAGGHWKRISNGIPPEQWVYSIAIDPTSPDVMYAASKNGKNKGTGEPGFHGTVVKTLDGGENWFEIVKGLNKDNEFYTIIIDPSNSSRLFLCTSSEGVFISLDAGESWSPMNNGLTDYETGTYPPSNVATPLRMSGNGAVLYLGTRGTGVFKRFIKPLPIAEAGPDQTVDEDTIVTLDGSGSISNVSIVSYVWTFTDVTPKSLRGETVTYNFTNPGVYLITLNVTDDLGNSCTDTVVITVNDVTPPVADAGTDQTVKVNTQVSFDAAGSSDNVGIVSYEWDFGDGATGTGKSATHIYAEAGTYTVVLTVTDAAGHRDTDTVTVTVMEEERFPAWMPAAVIAAMVAAAIAVYFIVIRKTS